MNNSPTMAETSKLIEDLKEDFLSCAICLDTYVEPRSLACMHTFCTKCLKDILDGSANKSVLPCPTCRREETIRDGNIETIQHNFFIANLKDSLINRSKVTEHCHVCQNKDAVAEYRCLECSKSMCCPCLDAHNRLGYLTRNHTTKSLVEWRKMDLTKVCACVPELCQLHDGETLKYYCVICDKAICRDCYPIEHQSHECKELSQVGKESKRVIENILEEFNAISNTHKSNIEAICKWKAYTENICYRTKMNINDQKTELIKKISSYAENLCERIDDITNAKTKNVDLQKGSWESELSHIKTLCDLGKAVVAYGRNAETINTKKQLQQDLAIQQQAIDNGYTFEGTCFKYSQGDADQCQLDALLGSFQEAQLVFEPMIDQCASLLSELTETHSFSVPSSPRGVVYVDKGKIAVTSYDVEDTDDGTVVFKGSGHVRIYTLAGDVVTEFKAPLDRPRWGPLGIAVTKDNFFVVTDKRANAIDIFNESGEFWCTAVHVEHPTDVAIDKYGKLVVCKGEVGGEIEIYNAEWTRRLFTTQGAQLENSTNTNGCVAVLTRTNEIISTYDDGVVAFDDECKSLWHYHNDDLGHPRGICTTQTGYILIADGKGEIVVLDSKGAHQQTFKSVEGIFGLTVTKNDDILVVVNNEGNVINLYKYLDKNQ